MSNYLISVIIPCYNTGRFIREALNSILSQTYKNFEIIAIDDCSTDDTWNILIEYEKLDIRIRAYRNETNLGLINTLNKAISLCRGDYIARMDSDDISMPTRFEKQLKILTDDSTIDIVSVFPVMIDEQSNFHSSQRHFYCTTTYSAKFKVLFESPFLHAAILAKSEVLISHPYIYNENFLHIEDYELWSRLLYKENVTFKIIPEHLYLYRLNPNSVSHKFFYQQCDNHLSLSKWNLKMYLNYEVNDETLKILLLRNLDFNTIKPQNLIHSTRELKKIKSRFLTNYKSDNILAHKEIETWMQQRILRMNFHLLVYGTLLLKILCLLYFIQNASALLKSRTYYNIKSRISWQLYRFKL